MQRSVEQARAFLGSRLYARRSEIEQEIITRAHSISDPTDADPVYREGLRSAIGVALDYALETIKRGEARASAPPPALLAQARMATRVGIGLDLVLRRYLVGYSLIGEFLLEEAEREGLLRGGALRHLMRGQAAVFERLLTAVAEEYMREDRGRLDSTDRRRAQRVERLLAGEPLDTTELGYDFDGHHLAIVATGPGAAGQIREFAASLDRRLLLVQPDENAVWAWFGGRRRSSQAELHSRLCAAWPADGALAIGEPGEGLAGWRLSHRQAAAALPVARRSSQSVVRYGNVALLASMLGDDLLATSLRRLYLDPLEGDRDGGEVARTTLRAYFATERNMSSTAVVLGVTRNTVANRLHAIEDKLGREIAACAAEIEAVLRLDELCGESHSVVALSKRQEPSASDFANRQSA